MSNQILKKSLSKLCEIVLSFIVALIELMDLACTKLNEIYKRFPNILLIQCFGPLGYTYGVIERFSRQGPWSGWVYVGMVGYVGLFPCLVLKTYAISTTPYQYQYPRTPVIRAGIQLILQMLVALLANWKLNDGVLTLAIFSFLCHIVTLMKIMGTLKDLRAGDALLSIASTYLDEMLQNSPYLKIFFTIFFAMLVLFREHREKVKEKVTQQIQPLQDVEQQPEPDVAPPNHDVEEPEAKAPPPRVPLWSAFIK